MVVNMNMKSDSPDGINSWLADTISFVFSNVYTIDVAGSTNRELFASDSDKMTERLRENLAAIANPELHSLMEKTADGLAPYVSGGRVLTDDKAPVELLGMKVIDGLIQEELEYYRKEFKENGIQALIG